MKLQLTLRFLAAARHAAQPELYEATAVGLQCQVAETVDVGSTGGAAQEVSSSKAGARCLVFASGVHRGLGRHGSIF